MAEGDGVASQGREDKGGKAAGESRIIEHRDKFPCQAAAREGGRGAKETIRSVFGEIARDWKAQEGKGDSASVSGKSSWAGWGGGESENQTRDWKEGEANQGSRSEARKGHLSLRQREETRGGKEATRRRNKPDRAQKVGSRARVKLCSLKSKPV